MGISYIDMHMHTNHSDGELSPKEIINLADIEQTKILSITDHDSIAGLEEFKSSIADDMIGIKGVEFSSYIIVNNKRYKIHILGYAFDEKNGKLNKLLTELKLKRYEKHIELLTDLKKRIKAIPEKYINDLDFYRYCWFNRDVVDCFKKAGYDEDTILDLKNYYKQNRFSYGNDYNEEAKRVIDSIKEAGGYVIFAHPYAYGFDEATLANITLKLMELGIDGIEVFQSDCSDKDSIKLLNFVNENNLLFSVGSDFHRLNSSDGRMIGHGINNNLCVEETSLSNTIIDNKQYFKSKK